MLIRKKSQNYAFCLLSLTGLALSGFGLTSHAAPAWVKIGSGTPPVCSVGYIPVGAFTLPGSIFVPAFCVMKYEAKKNDVGLADRFVGGPGAAYPVSTPDKTPWFGLTWQDARTACASVGVQLISENQWLSIAHQVVGVLTNWTSGVVGTGALYQGHWDGNPARAAAADVSDANGYYDTGNTTGSTQRRTLTLPNGQVIWDLSGNIAEYTNGVTTNLDRYAPVTPGGYVYSAADAGTIATNVPLEKRPPSGYGHIHGMGNYLVGTGGTSVGINTVNEPPDNQATAAYTIAFVRGGSYNQGASRVGVFGLNHSLGVSYTNANVGFRCAK